MNVRWTLLWLASTVPLLLLALTAAGIAVDRHFGTAPLALAFGVGAGVLFATATVTRVFLDRYEWLAPRGQREDEAK